MAKLVKIQNVYLYVGFTKDAGDCYSVIQQLRNKNIEFTLLNYSADDKVHEENFKALSTWTFGVGDSQYKKEFNQYPILTWEECYDNWVVEKHAAHGLREIQNSVLLNT
jgi:hypothetical protein